MKIPMIALVLGGEKFREDLIVGKDGTI